MVRKSNENQTVTNGVTNNEKVQNAQPRSEQPKSEQQPRSEQQRSRPNHQNFNTKGQYQTRQQNGPRNADTQNAPNKEAQTQNKDTSRSGQNQGQYQSGPRNNNHSPRSHDGHSRENVQPRGYYRDRNREADKDTQPRQHSVQTYSRHSNIQRNRAEETIDDIKQDIIRLEKEIELEIKEIKSLKFL